MDDLTLEQGTRTPAQAGAARPLSPLLLRPLSPLLLWRLSRVLSWLRPVRPLRAWRGASVAVLACAVLEGLAAGAVLAAQPASQPAPSRAGTPGRARTAEGVALSFREQLMAVGVRILVESAIHRVDLEKAKKSAVRRIREKPEADYRRQVDKIFDDLASVDVHEVLGVTRSASREQVVAAIERTSKPQLLEAMNGISDKAIADLLDRKLAENGASSVADAQEYFQTELEEILKELSG